MSDKTETGQICRAAGDPCIIENIKPAEETSSKIEVPEITSNPEVALSLNVISTDDNKISPEDAIIGEGDASKTADKTIPAAESAKVNGSASQEPRFSNLQEEVQKRTNERDNYQKILAETEKKLAALQAAYDAATSGKGDEMSLRRELEGLKNSLAKSQAKLNDRARLMANQENQINALTKQVSSLKEVVAITKDLLEIRNTEVKHLQEDVDSMENRITAERDRHNLMMKKMDAAARLNADLKIEYETQLRLFQDLRGKYEEKVTLLTAENKAAATEESTVQPALQ